MASIAIYRLVGEGLIPMARRAFEEEAGLNDPAVLLRDELDSAATQPLEGLPHPDAMLFETGRALAAALAAGVFLCALLQWTGVR
jgi:hypothetical protein